MTQPAVLIVDDEEGVRRGLCDLLVFHGYTVTGVEDGRTALAEAQGTVFDLVLLDVMLPDMNGFDICKHLREQNEEQPIIMITARGSEEDVLHGFDVGADDYITKPFAVREVVARVRSLLRRSGALAEAKNEAFVFGPWSVDAATGYATQEERRVALSERELRILRVLADDAGRIISRRKLLREVWGFDNPEMLITRTVDMHIAKLRKKIEDSGRALIQTVRGQGYRYDDSAP